jgi:hypothetical protein
MSRPKRFAGALLTRWAPALTLSLGLFVAAIPGRAEPLPSWRDGPAQRSSRTQTPLDTNGVERALRGVVVGRKNHYGSRSERGTRVAALFYSLIESAKLCGVEPPRLSARSHSPGHPEPGNVHARPRPQVLGTLREIGS